MSDNTLNSYFENGYFDANIAQIIDNLYDDIPMICVADCANLINSIGDMERIDRIIGRDKINRKNLIEDMANMYIALNILSAYYGVEEREFKESVVGKIGKILEKI